MLHFFSFRTFLRSLLLLLLFVVLFHGPFFWKLWSSFVAHPRGGDVKVCCGSVRGTAVFRVVPFSEKRVTTTSVGTSKFIGVARAPRTRTPPSWLRCLAPPTQPPAIRSEREGGLVQQAWYKRDEQSPITTQNQVALFTPLHFCHCCCCRRCEVLWEILSPC